MPELPKDIKQPTALTDYGVDTAGENAFFGFRCPDGDITFAMNHEGIGAAIHYLQTIAREAQHRRLRKTPQAEHAEGQVKQKHPVLTMDFLPETAGAFALLVLNNQDGTQETARVEFGLIARLHASLPTLIAEMQKRQQAHGEQH